MTKHIVVIGASRGIGAELVLQFAHDSKHRVYAFSRNIGAMNDKFAHLPNVNIWPLDLAKSDVKEFFIDALDRIPQIDVLIYNAGYLVNKPFLELSKDEILTSYQINVLSAFAIFQAAIPKFAKQAHVVSISSMGGFQGTVKFAGLSAYSTPKAALASLTELLADEYKNESWTFNCLALGAAQTEMLETAFPGYQAPLSAAEMANFIVDFSLQAHKYIRGKIIPVSVSTP